MHDIVCFVFYQSSVLVIEVIIGDMSKEEKFMLVYICVPHFISSIPQSYTLPVDC